MHLQLQPGRVRRRQRRKRSSSGLKGNAVKHFSFDRAPAGSECAVHAFRRRRTSGGNVAAVTWFWPTCIGNRSQDAYAAGYGSNDENTRTKCFTALPEGPTVRVGHVSISSTVEGRCARISMGI